MRGQQLQLEQSKDYSTAGLMSPYKKKTENHRERGGVCVSDHRRILEISAGYARSPYSNACVAVSSEFMHSTQIFFVKAY